MSDPRQQRDQARKLEQIQVIERPALFLPWTQRVLNPFPLASSGGAWGDTVQPWSVNLLAWYVSVFVNTTNNATNYWTIRLIDQAGTTLASFNTSAIAANTGTRFAITAITQPAATNTFIAITATATLSPGAIFIFPALALARQGN